MRTLENVNSLSELVKLIARDSSAVGERRQRKRWVDEPTVHLFRFAQANCRIRANRCKPPVNAGLTLRKVRNLFLILIFLFSVGSVFPETKKKWKIDSEQSFIQFHVKAKVENVKGFFHSFELNELKGKETPESLKGKISINMDSINTKSKRRDAHLKSKDFFEVEKFPTSSVIVKEIIKKETGYIANISLEVKDKKKSYSVPIDISVDKTQIKAAGTFKANRSDFEVNGNAIVNLIVDDNVDLSFTIVLVQ